jgi:hypothetical protein
MRRQKRRSVEKYAGHERVTVNGIAVRKLSLSEIREFTRVVASGPMRPIRLKVPA